MDELAGQGLQASWRTGESIVKEVVCQKVHPKRTGPPGRLSREVGYSSSKKTYFTSSSALLIKIFGGSSSRLKGLLLVARLLFGRI